MEDAAIVALRVRARLPLDDAYIASKDVTPHLTRYSLHRCLRRQGIGRLPKAGQEEPKKFKSHEIGCFHIVIADLRHESGKAFLHVVADCTSKLVVARIYHRATKMAAAGFLKSLIRTAPDEIHIVLTDNGVQFVQFERGSGLMFRHIFAKQIKAFRFKSPYEAIEQIWRSKPDIFIVKPRHHMPGLNI